MRIRDQYAQLTGREKSAIMMLALGEEHAAKLLSMMGDDEVRLLSEAMANLGSVGSNVVERLFVEFAEQMSSTGSLVGTYESTEKLLLRTLPKEKVAAIMEDIRGPAGKTTWEKLSNVNESTLANFLKNEYPQTVALVLSRMRPAAAAGVMAKLPEGFAIEVVQRMLRMEHVAKEIVEEVERTLRAEFLTSVARSPREDAYQRMAEIVNSLDRTAENRLLGALEERDRSAAEHIRELMFTFDDLAALDPATLQTVYREIDRAVLPLALKGAPEPVRQAFLAILPGRAAKMLSEEIAGLGAVKAKDVHEAQAAVVRAAKALEATGRIALSKGRAEDEMIY